MSSKHEEFGENNEGNKKFGCKVCGKNISSRQGLEYHVASKHEEESPKGKKTFQCKICKKNISSKQGLEKHISSKHGGKNLKG